MGPKHQHQQQKRKTVVGLFLSVWHDVHISGVMGEGPYTPGTGWWYWGRPAYANGDVAKYRWTLPDGNTPNNPFIDHQLDLIQKLGVDFVYADLTNGTQPEILGGLRALCQRRQERKRGPKIVVWMQKKEDLELFDREFYKKYDPKIFFRWKKKPLAMIAGTMDGWAPTPDAKPKPLPKGGIFDQYTVRWCWGLLGGSSGSMWNFKDLGRDRKPYMVRGKPEQMAVAVASQASYMTTEGDGRRGRENGAFFDEQAARVLEVKPQIVFVHSWNEWMAIKFGDDPAKPVFVDCFGQELSSDIEPMKGGHADWWFKKVKDFVFKLI
jgi:hypothetical protein